jgi:hypothetical protein
MSLSGFGQINSDADVLISLDNPGFNAFVSHQCPMAD